MAKVLGESGRYVSNQAVSKRQRMWQISFLGIAVASLMEGMLLSRWLFPAKLSSSASLAIVLGLFMVMFWFYKWSDRKMDGLEKERANMRRGATGEMEIALLLQDFPDDFCVINDLSTPFGNLDHVVIGPTGVFILDTKSWRGTVSPDGKGEVLLNGKPTDKPFVRQFIGRMMSVREKVELIASGPDTFYQAVFVFTAAIVQANWGRTSNVHCIRDDQLYDYIVNKSFGKKLQPQEAGRIAQAFLGLAHMDKEFDSAVKGTPAKASARSST